jgi:hypothetical protein
MEEEIIKHIGLYRLIAWECPPQGWVFDGVAQPPEAAMFQITYKDGKCENVTLTLDQLHSSELSFAPNDKERAIDTLQKKLTI